jgi:hypothetical protein
VSAAEKVMRYVNSSPFIWHFQNDILGSCDGDDSPGGAAVVDLCRKFVEQLGQGLFHKVGPTSSAQEIENVNFNPRIRTRS